VTAAVHPTFEWRWLGDGSQPSGRGRNFGPTRDLSMLALAVCVVSLASACRTDVTEGPRPSVVCGTTMCSKGATPAIFSRIASRRRCTTAGTRVRGSSGSQLDAGAGVK
jgi:hypothetical protein